MTTHGRPRWNTPEEFEAEFAAQMSESQAAQVEVAADATSTPATGAAAFRQPSTELRRLLQGASVEPLQSRIAAAWLGTTDWVEREGLLTALRAAVLWDCLPGFVADAGQLSGPT